MWHHHERGGVSNYRRLDCLLNRLFKRRSKKTPKLHVTSLCEGNPPVWIPLTMGQQHGKYFHSMKSSCIYDDGSPPKDGFTWQTTQQQYRWFTHHFSNIYHNIQSRGLEASHYNDVIMGAIAYQITSRTIVYSIVYSGADKRKHESSASQAFVRGIHRGPVISLQKWPVTRKMFPYDDVIVASDYDNTS